MRTAFAILALLALLTVGAIPTTQFYPATTNIVADGGQEGGS
jgi:hypothetical protein